MSPKVAASMRFIHDHFLVGLLLMSSLGIAVWAVAESDALRPAAEPIPATFFGMHIHRAPVSTPWPSVPFKAWRLWDTHTTWAQLEPRKGDWDWRMLDRTVDLAQSHGVEVLYTMGRSPRWASARPNDRGRNPNAEPGGMAEPRDLEDWRNYVRKVATRYKGRIKAYEVWNEPNLPNFYSGTPEAMVSLAREAYTVLKQVDPTITVVSPSAVGPTGLPWLEEYLKLGGGKYADVIGYHFYVRGQDPEAMLGFIDQVHEITRKYGVADKPLWNTEAGWLQPYRIDPQDGPAFMARAYILNWADGVSRFYWYAWDNQGARVRMTEDDEATSTPTARAYAELQRWMVGARMDSVKKDDATWICQLSRDGMNSWILWNPDHNTRFDVPRAWGVGTVRRLSGDSASFSGGKIEVGTTPILVEKSAH
ncbi:MAG: beta-galactosidase [Acidobacteriia bacterium]|nr:beta-galactosidase [Terriglobia bacterium]